MTLNLGLCIFNISLFVPKSDQNVECFIWSKHDIRAMFALLIYLSTKAVVMGLGLGWGKTNFAGFFGLWLTFQKDIIMYICDFQYPLSYEPIC